MCSFIGKIERGFDFLGFQFNREGMTISKKSVRKFAENIVLKLDSCIAPDTGQITPGSEASVCGDSRIYCAGQLTGQNMKGDLPIPETVSVYIRRWFLWVKSMYGKEKISLLQTESQMS
jgi:hypothetical protein